MVMTKYLIIGTGAAGISAIEAIRSQDSTGDITQVFDEPAGYYSRPGLAYCLTGEISEDSLFPLQKAYFERLQIQQVYARVKQILPLQHVVELDNGVSVSYNRLLIATGARAIPAQVPGLDLQGVIKLDSLNDLHHIFKYARKRRTAVVVGGGITSLELVEGFRKRGLAVHYFLRGERYWSHVLDETESRIVEQRLLEDGIQIHYQTEMAEILGSHGKVSGVLTKGGKKIKCDVVGIAIGVKPRMELAETASIAINRGIAVDEHLKTNQPDIFAAGDVAEVYNQTARKAILDSLWAPARKQGYTAGLNMAGKKVLYSKGVPFNVTRLAGLTTTIIGALGRQEQDANVIGIVRGESEGWRQMPDAILMQANFEINRLRIMVGEEHLLGALVMGDQTLSRALHHMIVNRINIKPIRMKLFEANRSITGVLGDFWLKISSAREGTIDAAIKS
jgi:NAD(P)H-nitrite reductase large subunit